MLSHYYKFYPVITNYWQNIDFIKFLVICKFDSMKVHMAKSLFELDEYQSNIRFYEA